MAAPRVPLLGAIPAFREAIRLDPGVAEAHRSLGLTLQGKGDFDGALATFREALRIDPTHYGAYVNMGALLCDRLGRYDEAIAAFREAIRISPNIAHGYGSLGVALFKKGDFAGAVEPFRKAAARDPNFRSLDGMRADAERLAPARARLEAVLKGEDRPKSAEEWALFAEVSYWTRDYVSSVRLYKEAFAAGPRADPGAARRRAAACAAAHAGPEWHGQALEWLRADLRAWQERGGADAESLARTLRGWKADPDLASVRDGDGLSDGWRAFWGDVDALLARTEEGR